MIRSKELLMLQEVWRKAYRAGSLDLEFATHAGAVRARLQLYNAVKRQKSGEDMDDLELVHAAEQLEIVWQGELAIRLQKRADNDMMQGIEKALGKRLEEFQDPGMLESSNRLLEELGGLAPATPVPPAVATQLPPDSKAVDAGLSPEHQDNPFYGKRGAGE